MKISQSKNYKKPLYAIGVAATVMSLALTGCTDPVKEEKDTDAQETTAAQKEETDKSAEVSVIVENITAGIVYIHTK